MGVWSELKGDADSAVNAVIDFLGIRSWLERFVARLDQFLEWFVQKFR